MQDSGRSICGNSCRGLPRLRVGGSQSRAVGGLLLDGFEDDGRAAFVWTDDDGAEEGVVAFGRDIQRQEGRRRGGLDCGLWFMDRRFDSGQQSVLRTGLSLTLTLSPGERGQQSDVHWCVMDIGSGGRLMVSFGLKFWKIGRRGTGLS